MAPPAADSARSTRAKSNTPAPVSRIIPAIPLPLARSSKQKKPYPPHQPRPDNPAAEDPVANRKNTTDHGEERDENKTLTHTQLTNELAPSSDEGNGGSERSSSSRSVPAQSHYNFELGHATESNPPSEDRQMGPDETQEQYPTSIPDRLPKTNASRPQRPTFELPPPFYPSTDRSTPTSASSATFTRPQPLASHIPLHHPRPGNSSIVFGGHPESSSASPVPTVTNGTMAYPPPPPGFMGSQFVPPMAFSGHAHTFSEPNAQIMYPSMTTAPQGSFGPGRDQQLPAPFRPGQPWHSVNGHGRLGSLEPFSPQLVQTRPNGGQPFSRSASQASSPRVLAMDDVADPAVVDDLGRKRFLPMTNGVNPRKFTAPPFQPLPHTHEVEFHLRDYLRARFGGREYADLVLKLRQGESGNLILVFPVHSLLLGRNRRLASLMASSDLTRYEGGLRVLDIFVEDRFFDGPIFAEALRYLYSEDLLLVQNFLQGLSPFTGPSDVHEFGSPPQRMKHALAYVAAGHFLQVPNIVARGFEIATALLRWDTLEVAIPFALDGGLDATWRVEDSLEDRASPSSSDDAFSKFETDSTPTYGSFSTQFLHAINGFIVQNFPTDFELDTTAVHLHDLPRLPWDDVRPASRDPRLSQIQFGQVPVDATAGPTRHITTLLSGILLSLPFPVLRALVQDFALCSRLGQPRFSHIMQSAVDERESRRRKALSQVGGERSDATKQNLLWSERLESSLQHPSGLRLIRSRQGIDTPASTNSNKSS
ncbi:uncharacterized protein IWZ02DRAFT_444114 [Phyllosticta citriasiana]|uniref:uncharacterized protein n=1 Tax=Phyllosticta citriasiana TaxID=595635 RepID=UPI0030FD461F